MVLKRYRKGIIEQQLATKRLADVAMDLFVGMCLLSRVSTMIAERGEAACSDEIKIAKVFTHLSRGRITANLRGLVRNADTEALSLADSILSKGGYGWDVV